MKKLDTMLDRAFTPDQRREIRRQAKAKVAAIRLQSLRENCQVTQEELAHQIDEGQADYRLPETSLAALELCEAAYLSSAHRCKVTLPLSEFEIPAEPHWSPGQPYEGHGGRDGRKL